MQRTAPVTPAALADDVLALMMHLLKASSQDVFAAVGELDLSMTQVKMLHAVESEDDLSLKGLAERLGLSLGAASRAVDGLHQRGLIERREDEQDRRIKRVSPTEAGQAIVTRLNQARRATVQQFALTLTDDERQGLAEALAPIVAREEIAACRTKGTNR
jgi:DNA-binding MarR family transcriptional regulator